MKDRQSKMPTSTPSATDRIVVTDYGVEPGSRVNAVPGVQRALEACRALPQSTLVFPKGRYDFWPDHCVERAYHESNTHDLNPKTLAILIEDIAGLTLEGSGSLFVFHGQVQPFTIDRSRDITIRNVGIDWDIPLTAQGKVVDGSDHHLDVQIDVCESPYVIENGQLVFVGEGWKSPWWGTIEFDPVRRIVMPQTADAVFGGNWEYTAAELGRGLVRLTHHFKRTPPKGNVLILRHNPRKHAGMFLINSRNIELAGIGLYHTGGLGILAQFCENLTVRDSNVVPNPDKDRFFSGHDDGVHVSNCRGLISITHCRFAGLMDDPINIHGTSVRIIEKSAPDRLVCQFMHRESTGLDWCHVGDAVGFVRHDTLGTAGHGVIKAFKVCDQFQFEVTFEEAVPAEISAGDALENLTWMPDLHVKGCWFGSCRARGPLVSTPGRVIVEDSIFESSGSAILIAGDANGWYESGGVRNVVIRNNEFRAPCMTSLYQFTEAIISIYPEIPVLNEDTPAYHWSIAIVGNTFHAFDYPVLFARSVEGLLFKDNRILRSRDFEPFHERQATFWLQACRNVEITGNELAPDVLGKNIRTEFMARSEVRLEAGQSIVWA
jgi:hypothetical protein